MPDYTLSSYTVIFACQSVLRKLPSGDQPTSSVLGCMSSLLAINNNNNVNME